MALFGINYNTDGTRYIALVLYDIYHADQPKTADYYKDIFGLQYEELYIMDFNPNYNPLIQDIVLNGCRIS